MPLRPLEAAVVASEPVAGSVVAVAFVVAALAAAGEAAAVALPSPAAAPFRACFECT